MTPERLGALQPTRLSFIRSLTRRMIAERWDISCVRWDIDSEGHGVAVYRLGVRGRRLHAVVFSYAHGKPSSERAFEVNWDILLWLIEGEVTDERIEEAAAENARIVHGEGRAGRDTLSWTRGNRSGRSFEEVVASLAAGRQPPLSVLSEVGYLIRNVYYQANGMNGSRMFAAYPADHPLKGPYHVQMLGLYLMREFSFDLVERMARSRSAKAVQLDPAIKRYLGVGNTTGIGLNLLAVNHPALIDRWITLREHALAAAISAQVQPGSTEVVRVLELLDRNIAYRREDATDYGDQFLPGKEIAGELSAARATLVDASARIREGGAACTWGEIYERFAAGAQPLALESLHALLIEAYPEIADGLDAYSAVPEWTDVVPQMTVGELLAAVERDFGWALAIDMESAEARHWIWYKSVEGEEPRMARAADGHVPHRYSLVPDVPGRMQALVRAGRGYPGRTSVARFLLENPQHRTAVESVQSLGAKAYAHVRANMLHRDFSPLWLSRFVLCSLKGMDKAHFMGDRWVRGVFLQGAPAAADIAAGASDDWIFPALPAMVDG